MVGLYPQVDFLRRLEPEIGHAGDIKEEIQVRLIAIEEHRLELSPLFEDETFAWLENDRQNLIDKVAESVFQQHRFLRVRHFYFI